MKIYDTLIIGSSYSSAGYALANPNTVIIEESQVCDTQFYFPMRGFGYNHYEPSTSFGKKLYSLFDRLNLFRNGLQNVNCFETAFCKFLSCENINIMLRSRIVEITEQQDGIFSVKIITAEGLDIIYAKKVFDATSINISKNRYMTVLYLTQDNNIASKSIAETFQGCYFAKAFYDGRFAVHIPTEECTDVNEILCTIHDKWEHSVTDAKVIFIPPVTFLHDTETEISENEFPKDCCFSNPIAAFEAGYLFTGGKNNEAVHS